MTSSTGRVAARTADGVGRSRDAQASRQALFSAAQQLFGQKGFESTTLREIGERAGVDAALVARYFGSKADLYVAVVAAERLGSRDPAALAGDERPYSSLTHLVEEVLRRSDEHGPGPILQALVRFDTTDEIREAAEARVLRRLVEPLSAAIEKEGEARSQLRAEVAIAALLGVSLGRSLAWFDQIAGAERAEVVAIVVEALERVLGEITGPLGA
ncbi:MAG TPA: TetR family transcriptional regulator [Acidimicrobiales bacterium]